MGGIGSGLISTWSQSTTLGKVIGYQIVLGARGAGMQIVCPPPPPPLIAANPPLQIANP